MKQRLQLSVVQWIGADRPSVDPILGEVHTGFHSCPSYPPSDNAEPFAYRTFEGELVFCLPDDVPDFRLRESVRMHGPCIAAKCVHWSGHCNLGAALSRSAEEIRTRVDDEKATDTSCGIATRCRWRAENGPAACRACSDIDYFEFL